MKTLNARFTGLLAAALLAAYGTAIAAGPPASPPTSNAPSQDSREKMALIQEQMAMVHKTMAACLRSDKSIASCRAEMMQHCHDIGARACPMMSFSGRHASR